MPKQRSTSVSKQCEECGGSSPVACRVCTACGAEFYSQANEKSDSPDIADVDHPGGERRRSERVKRDKPDYYDALEFENKRRAERAVESSGGGRERRETTKAKGRGRGKADYGANGGRKQRVSGSSSRRATMTWMKGRRRADEDEEEEPGAKRRKKKKAKENQKDDSEDDNAIEYLEGQKGLVLLTEINRKLATVMCQPG